MDTIKIEELAGRIRQKRLGKGVREVAKEIGISPATLSRLENGKIPDLETYSKICQWLGDDPAIYLGIQPSDTVVARAQVHFKKEITIKPETAKALGEMILLVQKAMLNEEEVQG